MEYESCSVFQAKELTTTSKQLERYLVISHSAILFFEPYVKKRLQATLIQWATIQSLERIKRTLENPDEVSFYWRKVDESVPILFILGTWSISAYFGEFRSMSERDRRKHEKSRTQSR